MSEGSSRRDLEVATAHLARALVALGHMERIITATGGYLTHVDQAALFEARAVLAEHGRLPAGSHAPWVNREPCRGCGKTADVTGGVCGACEELRRRLDAAPAVVVEK